mgnify:CR=1 FL=1
MAKLRDKQTIIDHLSAAQRGIPDNGIRTRALKDGLDIAKREVERESSFDDMIVLDRITKAYYSYDAYIDVANSIHKTLEVVGLNGKYSFVAKLIEFHWVVTFQLR